MKSKKNPEGIPYTVEWKPDPPFAAQCEFVEWNREKHRLSRCFAPGVGIHTPNGRYTDGRRFIILCEEHRAWLKDCIDQSDIEVAKMRK